MTSAEDSRESPAGNRVREGWAMLASHRPHAAWAIWQSVLQEFPGEPAARAALDTLAAATDLPEVARKPLRFLPPADEASRKRWDKALRIRLASSETPAAAAPADAALAFRSLLDDAPDDTAALWNLAVCQAWMGTNRSAVESLDRYVELSVGRSPDRAADAWTLAELLRHGAGAEDLADSLKLSAPIPDAILRSSISAGDLASAFGPLVRYDAAGVPRSAQQFSAVDDSGIFAADILSQPVPAAGDSYARLVASVVASGPTARISAPADPASGLFFRELRDQWQFLTDGESIPGIEISVLPIAMLDAAAFRFHLSESHSDPQRKALTHEAIATYFEAEWIDQPRHGLGLRTPLQASTLATPVLKARLEGIIQFHEQLARRPGREALYAGYDFDRLRYRLRLGSPPGKDDAKGEARHKALSLYDPVHVGRIDPQGLSPDDLAIAWKTASAVHDDATAIRLGQYIAEHALDALERIPLADFIAPFLRRSLQEGTTTDSGRDWLDFALKIDAERHSGRERPRLLKWKAEFASRCRDAPAARKAWEFACEHPDSPPILTYEAVVDMWDLPGGPGTAIAFATDALAWTTNPYVRLLLKNAAEAEPEA